MNKPRPPLRLPVRQRLRVSRWRCRQARCETQVFTERLAEVCGRHGRHTRRLGDIIHVVGYALGGRGGERLLGHLGMAVSDDTILRILVAKGVRILLAAPTGRAAKRMSDQTGIERRGALVLGEDFLALLGLRFRLQVEIVGFGAGALRFT